MTFVGKILVIVIMVFSLLFLGISTVVFTTHTNWKEATAKERQKVQDLTNKTRDLTAAVDLAKKEAEKSKADNKAAIEQDAARIKSLEDGIKTAEAEVTAARSKLEVAQESAKTALAEAAENRKETEQLRAAKSEVEKQANAFKLQQTELVDKIRDQERQIKTLDDNNKDLRDRVAKYSTLLRKHGLSDDIRTVQGLESPPPVQGEVSRVDVKGTQVEITIGSDDGIVAGHELFVYRTQPQPQYLGKIRIISADPDQAVGQVMGRTVNGLKIKEGDIVSSTIRPRS
jgi:hypothetical protein